MLGQRLVLVTLHRGLQSKLLALSKIFSVDSLEKTIVLGPKPYFACVGIGCKGFMTW
jgi:hypothetical protein